jgi:spore coat protein U-like protein
MHYVELFPGKFRWGNLMPSLVRFGGCATVCAAAVLMMAGSAARAATATSTMTVNSATTLNFGTQGVLSTNVDQTSTIQVTCTNTTPYNIGLDAGTGTGATVATRKMTSGANTVNYTLYSNSGRTTVWGNTVGTDTQAATGNGSAQTYTVLAAFPRRPHRPPAPTPTRSPSR